jgi:hypothetical protein
VSRHRLADGTGVRVMAERCPTCVFRPGNRMHLRPGRLRDLIAAASADDAGSIVCHATLSDDLQAVCRGFYDSQPTPLLQVAGRLGAVVEWTRPA